MQDPLALYIAMPGRKLNLVHSCAFPHAFYSCKAGGMGSSSWCRIPSTGMDTSLWTRIITAGMGTSPPEQDDPFPRGSSIMGLLLHMEQEDDAVSGGRLAAQPRSVTICHHAAVTTMLWASRCGMCWHEAYMRGCTTLRSPGAAGGFVGARVGTMLLLLACACGMEQAIPGSLCLPPLASDRGKCGTIRAKVKAETV